MTSIFLATVMIQPRNLVIDEVNVTKVYAGRRGMRVVEEFTAHDANGTVRITVYPFNTNVDRTPAIVKKGDRVTITLPKSAQSAKVAVSDVKF
ncbi:MAG: hypothetical protein WCK51_04720 [Armatimonadota bacterium]